jgi:8-amino-7-oxononanoate synthase
VNDHSRAPGGWAAWATAQHDDVRAAGRWRAPRDFDAAGPEGKLAPDGRPVVSFASNDYLGLSQHPAVVAAAHAALDRWGAGSGSARLIVGSRPVHSELEDALAQWKGEEAAVLFPTGYAANLGVLTTFGRPDVLVCSDELNHASIIDGCRLSRARVEIFPHRDVDALVGRLRDRTEARAIVVTDTVFSMDGDVADVESLASTCSDHGALLVVDEAHAVLGPHPDLAGVPHLRVGTLSKTLGALGGFVTGDRAYTDLVVNRARSYIFTTAPTPADSAAALTALGVLRSSAGDALVARLRDHVDTLRPGHPSPIVPIVLGDEQRALAAAASLLDRGFLVPAIRPPTVAPGTSRLRVALSAAHTPEQVAALAAALVAVVDRD